MDAHRAGGFERIGWILADWERARTNQVVGEARMVDVLDQLGLTELVCSIDGLSPVGAAAILAETGDLSRFTSARAMVKLAGLAPGNGCPARSPAKPGSPAPAARGCGSPRGEPYGAACRTTGCTSPDTGT